MNKPKKSLLNTLDPRNFKLETKFYLLVFAMVLVTMGFMAITGLIMLRNLLVETSYRHLEEIAHLKETDIEIKINNTENLIENFANSEKSRYIANEFISAFRELSPDMFRISDIREVEDELREYYYNVLAKESPLSGENVINYFPLGEKCLVGQYVYHYQNTKPLREKDAYVGASAYNTYNNIHLSNHTDLRDFVEQGGFSDLMIVDPVTASVVYSVKKNLDYATNLFDGPFRDSPLSKAFRKAIASQRMEVFFEDFTNYPAAFDKSTAFFAIPIFFFDQLESVMIVSIGTDFMDRLIYDDFELMRSHSLEYNIIGDDLKLRNNPKQFLIEPEEYSERRFRKSDERKAKSLLEHIGTGGLALYSAYPQNERTMIESGKGMSIRDFDNTKVLATSRLIKFAHSQLRLLIKVDRSEALIEFARQSKFFSISVFSILIISFLVGRLFGRTLARRLRKLYFALELLFKGEKVQAIDPGSPDELGSTIDAFNQLRQRMVKAEEFAIEMSGGNYSYVFETFSDNDSLGTSLNLLNDSLVESKTENDGRKKEDEIRNWINTGVAKFNDLLRQNNDDIHALSYSIIENLIDYLQANQGGVFLVEGEEEKNKKINLVASFAYNRRKFLDKSVDIGEGLLGSVYLGKKAVFLKELPTDYIEITSGLGESVPRNLYILPLLVNGEVFGMIEIASFSEILPHQMEFLEEVAESIASTFVSVRLNMQTATLLEESNRKAEEIAQQEEEMRQNMEEMQATQEELARLRQEDEKRSREMQLIVDNTRNLLKNLLDTIPGAYILKDPNGVIHLANAEGAAYYGKPVETIIGKTDHELLSAVLYKKEHQFDEEVLESGEKTYTEELSLKGEKVKYAVIKKQFHIEEIHQMGVLTIRQRI